MNLIELLNKYTNEFLKASEVLDKNKNVKHNEKLFKNYLINIKNIVSAAKKNNINLNLKNLENALFKYNCYIYNYNKKNNTNYKGINDLFKEVGINLFQNKFSVESYFNY